MIVGVGIEWLDVPRFEAVERRFGNRLRERLFTEAERAFAESLGGYVEDGHIRLVWECADPDVVSLRIIAAHPTLLPDRLAGLLPLGRLDRTIEIRVESPR